MKQNTSGKGARSFSGLWYFFDASRFGGLPRIHFSTDLFSFKGDREESLGAWRMFRIRDEFLQDRNGCTLNRSCSNPPLKVFAWVSRRCSDEHLTKRAKRLRFAAWTTKNGWNGRKGSGFTWQGYRTNGTSESQSRNGSELNSGPNPRMTRRRWSFSHRKQMRRNERRMVPQYVRYLLAANYPARLIYRNAAVELEIVSNDGLNREIWALRARKLQPSGAALAIVDTNIGRDYLNVILHRDGFPLEVGSPAAKILERLVHEGYAERMK